MSLSIFSNSQKRLDLQGIRGIAILGFLGFNFLPKFFPNGYLGVDQFFVLSGFLMSMLLQKSEKEPKSNLESIFGFYQRRLKRILPLYFLMITVSLLALFNFFPDTVLETNVSSGERAMVFMSNRKEKTIKTEEEDDFSMLPNAIDIFTHTWSLSVGAQFNFLVPIIYIFISKTGRSKILSFTILTLFSYCYSVLILEEPEAFNSLFGRCWQLFLGMIVHMIPNSCSISKSSKVKSLSKYFCLISILWILIYPSRLDLMLARPLFTILSSILILVSKDDKILSYPLLTYIGDISYPLYLIHWPIYAYWKFVWGENQNVNPLIALGVAVGLAVISYKKFEKWYLSMSNKSLTLLCIYLFSFNFCLLEFDRIRDFLNAPKVGSRLDGLVGNRKISFEEARSIQRGWTIHDYRNLYAPTCEYDKEGGPLGYCRHTGLDEENGKLNLMIIGNNWAANHARIFYDKCRTKSKRIVQVSEPGCDPLVAHRHDAEICIPMLSEFVEYVKSEQPDYLFIVSRMMDVRDPIPPNITKFEDDPIFHFMKIQTNRLLKNVKKRIFLLNAFPDFDAKNLYRSLENVKNGEDLLNFDKSLMLHDGALARKRYQKLVAECPKCVLIDYKPIFYRNSTKTWRFYNVEQLGLSYFTSENHFSFHGLEMIRSVWTNICNKL